MSGTNDKGDEVQTGYFIEFKPGWWQKRHGAPTNRHGLSGEVYHGSVTKDQVERLTQIVHDFINGKVPIPSAERAINPEQRSEIIYQCEEGLKVEHECPAMFALAAIYADLVHGDEAVSAPASSVAPLNGEALWDEWMQDGRFTDDRDAWLHDKLCGKEVAAPSATRAPIPYHLRMAPEVIAIVDKLLELPFSKWSADEARVLLGFAAMHAGHAVTQARTEGRDA